mmetsp:Transcript_38249/g.57676  ORF Transcript_38249/g.57676 Transcript_38249/m.57676 type:complete len:207 (-) Transcript_38249:180-800(-)
MKFIAVASLAMVAPVFGLKVSSGIAPDVANRVLEETREDIQIHDDFLAQERQDDHVVQQTWGGLGPFAVKSNTVKFQQQQQQQQHNNSKDSKWSVALDRDLKTKMLVQVKSGLRTPAIKDPCDSISCGDLICPGSFVATTVDGHCCPYCVNPEVKVEDAIVGPTGSAGGEASTFCKDVWCFPTMCKEALTNPTGYNGQCCPICPSL